MLNNPLFGIYGLLLIFALGSFVLFSRGMLYKATTTRPARASDVYFAAAILVVVVGIGASVLAMRLELILSILSKK
jgi:uncharacterized SAM-binding protein YcdF (DUF218 family)